MKETHVSREVSRGKLNALLGGHIKYMTSAMIRSKLFSYVGKFMVLSTTGNIMAAIRALSLVRARGIARARKVHICVVGWRSRPAAF